MTSAAKALPAVLERIDADLDKSLERLFELVRIPSISTDSAYKDFCRAAADHRREGPRRASASRPRCARPPAIRWWSARATARPRANGGPRVLFYGHYDVQPVDPLNLWSTPPFEPKIDSLPDGRKIILGARRLRRQGPAHDLRRGLPRLQGGDRQAAARHHHDDRGRGGMRLEEPVRLRAQRMPPSSSATSRSSATPACGTRRRRRSPPRCAACSTRRSSSPARTATCIPACSAAAPRNPIRVLAAHHRGPARRERPRHGAGLLRRREGAAGRHQGRAEGART